MLKSENLRIGGKKMDNIIGAYIMQYLFAENGLSGKSVHLSQTNKIVTGKVGTMKINDIFGAIQTAAKKEKLLTGTYREEHALYSAINDALFGICRGSIALQESSRTVYLNFAVARGEYVKNEPGDWVIVAVYGFIGSTTKGNEHEVMGFGIKPI